jgi:DNA-directed RNA polymerase specialized sigma24 family protein
MAFEGAADLENRLARLARAQDAETIAVLSTELLEALRLMQQQVSAARDEAVVDLSQQGMSLHEIARLAGLTRGRVFQIVQRGRSVGSGNGAR